MGYVNSTPPQVARVIGAWIFGSGLALLALTFGELGAQHPPTGAIWALCLVGLGGFALGVGTWRWNVAAAADRRYFAANAGSAILADRRRLESRLARVRNRVFLACILAGACFIVIASTLSCIDGVCTGSLPNHAAWLEWSRNVALALGIAALALASLVRIHAAETDRWEDLSSDELRRRYDGPVPGLRRSRWE